VPWCRGKPSAVQPGRPDQVHVIHVESGTGGGGWPARRTGADGDQPCKKAVDGGADGPVQLRATSSLDQFCSVIITVSVYFVCVCVCLWCACSVCVRVRKPSPRAHRAPGRAFNEAGGPMERGHLKDGGPSAASWYRFQ
jgi:hypothetical protein